MDLRSYHIGKKLIDGCNLNVWMLYSSDILLFILIRRDPKDANLAIQTMSGQLLAGKPV